MFKFLFIKEMKQFWRNPALPVMAVAFPLVVILVLPFLATMDVRNVGVSVVDSDNTPTSIRLTGKIAGSGYFHLADSKTTYSQAMSQIEHGIADVIISIPCGFEEKLITGQGVDLMISANSTNVTKGSLASSHIGSIIQDFAEEILEERGLLQMQQLQQSMSGDNNVYSNIAVLNLFNPSMDYRTFMLPAYMALLIIVLCSVFPALAIVTEREQGTLEQINVTPLTRTSFILAKLVPYILVGVVAESIAFAAAYLAYGFVPQGSFLVLYAATILMAAAMSALGLLISNFSNTFQQAGYMFFFVILTALLMGGLFTPVSSMPDWAKSVSYAMPTTYYMDIMRGVYLKGSGFAHTWSQFVWLAGFTLLFSVASVLTYKKRI
ncbi:MAG: ABC transporter permease [Bacteroidaceae bacterium]|nr:ABC transporter permease [Bacteroidaceae bacterium]